MRELAKLLCGDEAPDSLASMVFMRRRRRNLVGHLRCLLARHRLGPVAFWTIIPPDWEIAPHELNNFDPRKLMARF
jgi:hypothetical protein